MIPKVERLKSLYQKIVKDLRFRDKPWIVALQGLSVDSVASIASEGETSEVARKAMAGHQAGVTEAMAGQQAVTSEAMAGLQAVTSEAMAGLQVVTAEAVAEANGVKRAGMAAVVPGIGRISRGHPGGTSLKVASERGQRSVELAKLTALDVTAGTMMSLLVRKWAQM